MRLVDATSPESAGADLVLVPVGALEQHGAHLPLDTDTVVAVAVAEALGERLPGSWVAPAVAYGASGEHQHFPGTSSIGNVALRLTLIELVRSMRTWARRVVVVNGHGGNVRALDSAVAQLTYEGHDVTWVPCAVSDGDLHAGRTETSLMLHLRPASVRLDRAVAGDSRPLREILPTLLEGGVAAVSRTGVLGDPAGASADEGAMLLSEMVEAALDRLAPTLTPTPVVEEVAPPPVVEEVAPTPAIAPPPVVEEVTPTPVVEEVAQRPSRDPVRDAPTPAVTPTPVVEEVTPAPAVTPTPVVEEVAQRPSRDPVREGQP